MFQKLRKNKTDNEFYQSKYEYYREMSIYAVIFSVIASNFYWISDCQLFGRIAIETLFPRLFMLIPLILYLTIAKRITNYKPMVILSYLMIHGIMWCTIWSIYYLPIKQHANEGFIIMHLMFIALGFCAPIKWSILFHVLLIADILLSYPINHYENIDLMLTLGIPALIAVEFMLYITENSYFDHYQIKKELEKMSYYDQLTKVYNRNIIKDLCIPKTEQFMIKDSCIIIMDIDHFKNINDNYGHNVGDEVLIQIANVIKSKIIETNDILIRWGGEEFIVILTKCKLKDAIRIGESIRKAIEEYDNGICKFTLSVGITRYTGKGYKDDIKNADKALYYAKENGRNQVRVYDNEKIY